MPFSCMISSQMLVKRVRVQHCRRRLARDDAESQLLHYWEVRVLGTHDL